MANIIPAILESDIKEIQNKLDKLSSLVEWAQIDLMDGKFVNNISVRAEELGQLHTKINLEAHLMVTRPEEWLTSLDKNLFKRVYFHIEAVSNPEELIKKIKEQGFEAGLALNMETQIDEIIKFVDIVNNFLFLSIKPGWQGRALQPEVLKKIRNFKDKHSEVIVAIDGGVNENNIREIALAGVDNISAGSAVFASGEISNNLLRLKDKLT